MPIGMFVDHAKGERIERELTDEEVALLTETSVQRTHRLNMDAKAGRRGAYQAEADPLFFGWQRGENTEQEWLDKCEEIRQRFPYAPVPS